MNDESKRFLKGHLRELIKTTRLLIGGLQSMLSASLDTEDKVADFLPILQMVEDLYAFLQQNQVLGDEEGHFGREVADLKEEVEDFDHKYSILLGF